MKQNPTHEELSKLAQPFSILVNTGTYSRDRGCTWPVSTFFALRGIVDGISITEDSGPANGFGFDRVEFDGVSESDIKTAMQVIDEAKLAWRKDFSHKWSI